MKTLCALLVLVGYIAYVHGHACDKYAANTVKKTDTTHGEHEDQDFPLKDIINRTKTRNFVTQASKSGVTGSGEFCSAQTHGNGCLAVGHWRQVIAVPNLNIEPKEGADKLRMKTEYVAVTAHGYAIKYEYKIKGVDYDDYIFKFDDEEDEDEDEPSFKATKIFADGRPDEDVTDDVAEDVLAVIKSEFAMFYVGENFALYMSCDATAMWVTYDHKLARDEAGMKATEAKLNEQIQRLNKKVLDAEKRAAPKLIDVKIDSILTPVYLNRLSSN